MYTVKLWSFAKRSNSTKQPATNPVKTYDCEIMDGSGLLSPTIRLNTNFESPISYTYCQIPELGRYYFISNWTYDKGLYWAALNLDVLATYKTQIGTISTYVARAASEMDGRIVDTRYPIKTGISKTSNSAASNPFATAFDNGSFVVGIINNDSGAMGVTSYYVFTSAEFRAFAAFLLGNSSYLNSPPEISDSLLKCLVNPTQYISSCMWLPFTPSTGAGVTTIPVGWWTITGMSCKRLSGYTLNGLTATVQVPKHPDALTRGYYLLQEPYSSYYLDFPPFGAITIPANQLVDTDSLDLMYSVDAITGMGRCEIRGGPTGAKGTIQVVHAQVGVPVALAQNAPDLASPIQQAVSQSSAEDPSMLAVGWSKVGNWLSQFVGPYNTDFTKWLQQSPEEVQSGVGGAAGVLANIANAAVASKLPVQVIGGNGGFMSGYYPIKLTLSYAVIAPDNTAEWGKPLCQIKTLNTLSGFIQCADADFEISCTAPERAAIAEYLTGGFFYE